MFTAHIAEPNRVEVVIDGQLNRDHMESALDTLKEVSEQIDKGSISVEVRNYKLPTLGAIGEELSRLPEIRDILKRYTRAAVITDSDWVQYATEFQGVLIPDLEVKGFDRDNDVEAIAWLKTPSYQQ